MRDRGRLIAIVTVAFAVTAPLAALAQTEIDWNSNEPLTGTVAEGEVSVDVSGEGSYPLLVIAQPEVEPPRFQIDGTIRYQDVVGVAYLEMWTVLPDGSRFFTRTLANTGPLAYLTGSSEERPFSLPFELGEAGPVPIQLEINLVTEGSGQFWLGPLTLVSATTDGVTSTTAAQDTTTTSPADSVTTAASPVTPDTSVPAQEGGAGLLWGLGAAAVLVAGALWWLSSTRRTRAEEERRMDAIDSLGP
jgi:hypothetical protein